MDTTTITVTENSTAPVIFDREQFIKEYNETKAPKQRKIPCTKTGKMITLFGQNLHNRVQRFGNVEALLDNFVSRKAASKKYANI